MITGKQYQRSRMNSEVILNIHKSTGGMNYGTGKTAGGIDA